MISSSVNMGVAVWICGSIGIMSGSSCGAERSGIAGPGILVWSAPACNDVVKLSSSSGIGSSSASGALSEVISSVGAVVGSERVGPSLGPRTRPRIHQSSEVSVVCPHCQVTQSVVVARIVRCEEKDDQ